jgi:nicotinate dehydrogenase subunit B
MRAVGRRSFLGGVGALTIGFVLSGTRSTQRADGAIPPGLYGPPEDQIDSWIRIDSTGTATLSSGCCELGTGSSTGLLQIMAEELDVPMERVRIEGPDTARTVDQYVSSGSRTIELHAVPIRHAAAEARQALLVLAARELQVPVEALATREGVVALKDDPSRSVSYGALIGSRRFDLQMTGNVKPKAVGTYHVVGKSVPREDIPGKIFGSFTYVQDVKVPGMLHGRMVRPPAHGARVMAIDESSVAHLPGFVKVVRQGDLVGVVCTREEQAIRAARALNVRWSAWTGLPEMNDLYALMRTLPEVKDAYPAFAPGGVTSNGGDVASALSQAAVRVTATYEAPYHHHGSIGPSCCVADVRADGVTLWAGTQTPFGLRDAAAKFLGLPLDKVRLIYAEASGCYGQNGADDVAIDALVLSRAVGRPVRVQWSRADENGWEACKAARVTDMTGGIDDGGNIVAFQAHTFGFSGYSRPEYHEPRHGGEPASLVTAALAGWDKPGFDEGFGGAAANFDMAYGAVKNKHLQFTYLGPASQREGPLRMRVGSMRGVGGPDNVFATESFIDELAVAAKMDPVSFRLRHMTNPRGIAVIRAAAEKAGWQSRPAFATPGSGGVAMGRGIAYVGSEKSTNAAGVFEVSVDRTSGRVRLVRAVVAQDCGLIINPDAVTNQVEGGVLQATSRALLEQVTFDRSRITSLDWSRYPILTFEDLPDAIDVVLLDRPDLPPTGVGEPANCIVWAGIANAIFDAIGIRMRGLPFTPGRILAAAR